MSYDIKEQEGRPYVAVRASTFLPHRMSVDEQLQLKDKLLDIVLNILSRVFFVPDAQQLSAKLFKEQKAIERSINFTGSFVTLGNVLGHSPATHMSAWTEQSDVNDYTLTREETWDFRQDIIGSKTPHKEPQNLTLGKGEPPQDVLDGPAKHSDMVTVSLIREQLWDEARWSGTAFFEMPNPSYPAVLAPMFQNGSPAEQIFTIWRRELGDEDTHDKLRVTIIRGINVTKPHAYRVVIGLNPLACFSEANVKYVAMINRMNTMEPTSSQNLDRFLTRYTAKGKYLLTYATLENGLPKPHFDHRILKCHLHVREAWEIGVNDPDSVGINTNARPIIPKEHRKNAPVLQLLKLKRKRHS
jgi:hypothetical protein